MGRRHDILAAAALLFASASLSALDIKEEYQYLKTVQHVKEKTDLIRIMLDSDIYVATKAMFDDIRILDASGTEVPHVIRADVSSETEPEYCYSAAKTISLKKLADNRIEVCIEIPGIPPRPISGLTIRTPSKNYEKQVTVEGSPDMSSWKSVCKDHTVFDYSEVTPLSNNTLRFTAGGMKYFRLTIANFSEDRKSPRMELVSEKRLGGDFSRIEKINISTEHLKIDEIGYLTKSDKVVRTRNRTQDVPVSGFSLKDSPGKTEIFFSVKREPLDHVTIETASANFSRNFSVASSSDGKEWRELPGFSGKLTNIDVSGYTETNLSISLGSLRSTHCKITVSNGDAPPLKITGVKAYGTVNFLEILNSKEASPGNLTVYYGCAEAAQPSYDISEILEKMKNPTFAEVKPGPQQDNPDYRSTPNPGKFLNSRNFFTIVVVAMVLLLSWILFKSFRKIEAMNNGQ